MKNKFTQMTDAEWNELRIWENARLSKHFLFRAKKYIGNEFVIGNQITKSTYDNSYYLKQVVRRGKSRRLTVINEWWIDPDHVYFNAPNENGEYDMKVNMLW